MQYTTRKIFDLFAEGVMSSSVSEVTDQPLLLIQNINKSIKIVGSLDVTIALTNLEILIDLTKFQFDLRGDLFPGTIQNTNAGLVNTFYCIKEESQPRILIGSASLPIGIYYLDQELWAKGSKIGINYNYQDEPI